MNFNSSSYAVLLALVIPLYYLAGERRRQNYLLLAAGLFFYGAWDYRFLFLLLHSSSVDYIGGLGIVHERPTRRNGTMFVVSMLAATFALLAPIDWPGVWSAILPQDAFAGGWSDPTPWRGLIVAGGSWTNLIAAYGALGVLLLTTIVGYRIQREAQPKYFLIVSMVVNLALLGLFKYFDFFVSSAHRALTTIGFDFDPWLLGILVPAGISFYTFQAMSYTIDVYRGRIRPTHHFPDYLLFVSFFPHLVAGPIQPANWLLPQLRRERMFDWVRVQSGVFLIGWGLFKKIFIADNLEPVVAVAFDTAAQPSGPEVLLATYAFAMQIYADFSAYSDIARGTSRLFGIELTVNFNLPYIATNPREFWRRWHISLSSWLRDYLYVPLGGGRGGAVKVYRNLLITMILGGLWHGARFNFLLWGVYQGVLLCVHRLAEPWLNRLTPKGATARQSLVVLSWALFFHLMCYGWLLFRAEGASQIVAMTGALATGWQDAGAHAGMLARVLWFSWPILVMQFFQARADNLLVALTWPSPVRAVAYLVMFYLVAIFGAIESVEFIYFQFQLGPHERVRLGRLPAAALAFVLLAMVVEAVATATQQWFAGPYSWHWQMKRGLLDRGALNGDVAIFGTSALFFGLDPAIANQTLGGGRVVNLALDGMTLSQEVQLFRERARSSSRPRVAVLEFRELVVTPDTWFSFPYFRFWASWPDVLESRFYYWNLPIGLSYLENRVSTVFRHRVSLSSWLVESARARRPAERIYRRNQGISDLMAEHAGWSPPAVEDAVFEEPNSGPRPWRVNRGGELWLRYFMQIAVDHNIRVVLLVPPSPPIFVELPGPEGFRARLNAQVSRLREEFPALPLEVFELTGYALDDFGDEIHVSPKGRRKMSAEFATWIADYHQRYGLR